jgi:VWFA-related protein
VVPTFGPVFRSGVDAVRVELLVMDNDRPGAALTLADFVVSDNGVRQRVTGTSLAGSLSLALVLDTSASMNSPDGRKLARSATSAVRAGLLPTDRISVLTAAERVRLETPLARPDDGLDAVFRRLGPRADDFTALWDACLAAASVVVDAPGRPAVLAISDGADNASWLDRRTTLARIRRRGLLLDGVMIPWSSIRGTYDIAHGDINLREPAESTGGVSFDATDPALAQKIADRFAALRQSYILTYTPENTKPLKDGWHEIKVALRPGLKGKVQARPGYYEPKK